MHNAIVPSPFCRRTTASGFTDCEMVDCPLWLMRGCGMRVAAFRFQKRSTRCSTTSSMSLQRTRMTRLDISTLTRSPLLPIILIRRKAARHRTKYPSCGGARMQRAMARLVLAFSRRWGVVRETNSEPLSEAEKGMNAACCCCYYCWCGLCLRRGQTRADSERRAGRGQMQRAEEGVARCMSGLQRRRGEDGAGKNSGEVSVMRGLGRKGKDG
eukprot:470896-Rhodomonas_salina.5